MLVGGLTSEIQYKRSKIRFKDVPGTISINLPFMREALEYYKCPRFGTEHKCSNFILLPILILLDNLI